MRKTGREQDLAPLVPHPAAFALFSETAEAVDRSRGRRYVLLSCGGLAQQRRSGIGQSVLHETLGL
jgi:hypothetical protein